MMMLSMMAVLEVMMIMTLILLLKIVLMIILAMMTATMGDADDYASEDDGRFRFDDKCCSIGLKCIKFGFSLKIKRNNSLVICTSYPHSTYALVEDIDN